MTLSKTRDVNAFSVKNDKPVEVPAQPDAPEIRPAEEPGEKTWPDKTPEIIPGKDPENPKPPNEIPPSVK